MADTDMSNDTLTRIIPQDGWSPTICHKVPIVQTITNIVGDKGPGEIYEGGRIKNFHAKIDWEDQYGGSRVQADIITESSTDYGETWTMNEVQEHAEGSFELDYEGHERDFEVRLNGNSLYIRYRWLMNGQEITDASGSLEHAITVTDYPVKLEVDARYADNYGTHEIGDYTFNSAKVTMKSGVVKDVDEDNLTVPSEDAEWADKDGWQTQTWSYTENGRTVTAQVGANITALRDTKIEAEIVEEEVPLTCTLAGSYNYGSTEYKVYETNLSSLPDGDPSAPISAQGVSGVYLQTYEYWTSEGEGSDLSNVILSGNYCVIEVKTSDNIDVPSKTWTWFDGSEIKGEASPIFKEGAIVSKSNLLVTMTRNDGSTYEATDYWMSNNYALGRNKQSVTVQKGSLSTTLPVTVAYPTKVEVGNVSAGGNIITLTATNSTGETESFYFLKVKKPSEEATCDEGVYITYRDSDNHELHVYKGDSSIFSIGALSEPIDQSGYYILAYDTSELEGSYSYRGDDSPVTPDGGDFIKSAFYEYNTYTEPTHYKAYYECYDGTEGFDEVSEIDGEWSKRFGLKLKSNTPKRIEVTNYIYKTDLVFSEAYKNYWGIDDINDADGYPLYSKEENMTLGDISYKFQGKNRIDDMFIPSALPKDYLYIVSEEPITTRRGEGWGIVGTDSNGDFITEKFTFNILEEIPEGSIYYEAEGLTPNDVEELVWNINDEYLGDVSEDMLIRTLYPIEYLNIEGLHLGVERLSEYGSEVGTLTLGKKSYLYRAGLEPIDEENYLFIKDFKDIPFNYGLVKCYEPELQVTPMIEAKYEDGGVYAYPVEFPELMVGTVTLFGTSIEGWAVTSSDSSVMAVLSDEIIKDWAMALSEVDEGYYLISSSEKLRKDIDVRYEDGTSVVLIEE